MNIQYYINFKIKLLKLHIMLKIRSIAILILAVLSVTGLFLNIDSNAEYEIQSEQLSQEDKQVIDSIEKVDPQKPIKNKLKRRGGKIIDTELSLKKEFRELDKKINIIKGNNKIEIGTPAEIQNNNITVQDDKIIYESKNNTVDLTVENVEGGVRQVIVIHDKNQPNRYTFPMKLEEGQKFIKNHDESVKVVDNNEKTILIILKPWAKDKDNKDLQTYYEVEDKQIVQYINFENAVFPISADPTWCGGQIQHSRWKEGDPYTDNETRKKIMDWSMNVKLNWCGRMTASTGCVAFNVLMCASGSFGGGWDAWETAYNMAGPHYRFKERWYGSSTYWKMYHQFICHYANPMTWFKDEYNIDPWRYNVGQINTYKSLCNPPQDKSY